MTRKSNAPNKQEVLEPHPYLGLVQAAKKVPTVNGRHPNAVTIWRWMERGLRGVRLRHTRIGHAKVTTEKWLQEFFDALAEAPRPERHRVISHRTPRQRERAIARAERRMGLTQ
jgi:hypothetical protein